MGSYIASDRSIAAARASGAQHRSMNPTHSLEKAADAFLADAERNMPACTDVWTAQQPAASPAASQAAR